MTATGNPRTSADDDQPHRPIRDFEKWKHLGGDLDQDPRDNDVSDRDAIDFAPFQLDKKLLQARAAGSCARAGVNARVRKGHMKVMARLGDSGKCCLLWRPPGFGPDKQWFL